ncbi:MAG: biotin--[acetyl-CoA-carboxylase] ligase [Oscillospiraceae bacterium]|nr:biotin--[acetyl-CoA-carboxylase] ligase [Oscillospiraceae bacterium]
MEQGLQGLSTRVLGRSFIALERVDSTNSYLKSGDFPDGCTVVAAEQYSGRGRRGNVWNTAPGEALAMSVLFHSMKADDMTLLPLLCGLACARAIGGGAGVKWPNDVVSGGKKLVGILCESRILGDQVDAVCGFGVNLGQTADYFEKAGLPYAASVAMVTGQRPPEPLAMAAAILNQLEPLLERYREDGFAALRPEYEKACVTLGKEVRVLIGEDSLEGLAQGVDDDGALLCQIGGAVRRITAGSASVRGLYGYV